jgi:hypothetical protein
MVQWDPSDTFSEEQLEPPAHELEARQSARIERPAIFMRFFMLSLLFSEPR